MNKKMRNRVPQRDSTSAAWNAAEDEEVARRNEIGKYIWEHGYQLGGGEPTPPAGVDDVLAHLKSLPPHLAIQKAREWTGRTDILTLDQAIAAVRDAIPAEGTPDASAE